MADQIPDLEERFLEPEGWRWHDFTCRGYRLRYGCVFPKDNVPDAVVVCLPGLGEFGEKFFETARDLLAQNYAVWVLDWRGQGGSARYLRNTHKRHAQPFKKDVEDLEFFIREYVRPASFHPSKGRLPLVMLAHSMGGHLGLRALHHNPRLFDAAGFSAPMFGIRAVAKMPAILTWSLAVLLRVFASRSYIPGGGDWDHEMRPAKPQDSLHSTDPARDRVHNAWCHANPDLQVGHITCRWFYEAFTSCLFLKRSKILRGIQTPCLLSLAGGEKFVDNKAVIRAAKYLPRAELLEFPGAKHEILMEKDEIRSAFLEKFYRMIEDTISKRQEEPSHE